MTTKKYHPHDSLRISRVMIPATPIQITYRDYPLHKRLDNEGNEMVFKFTMVRGDPGSEYNYPVTAYCLNFRYENFIQAMNKCWPPGEIRLILVDVFEWVNKDGADVVSLFIDDDRLIGVDDYFYSYVDTTLAAWPPSKPII